MVTGLRWPWRWLALALGFRLALLAWSGPYAPFGDPFEYDLLGRSLAEHGHYLPSLLAAPGSPSAFRPPGYPYLLGFVYAVFGHDYTVARCVGVVLGVVTVLLVWLLARRVAGERVAGWAVGIAALAPSLAWVSCGLVSETLYIPLMLASVLAVLRFRDHPAARWALVAGLLLGASTLTRTNGLILVVPLALGIWQARRRWRDVGTLALGLVLAMAPWTIRNAVVLDTFAPLGTQAGVTLLGVFNHDAMSSGYFGVFRPPYKTAAGRPLVRRPGIDEAELDARTRDIALRFAVDHPGYVRSLVTHHVQQLFELRDVRITSSNSQREMAIPAGFARRLARGGFLILLVAALAGAAMTRRRWLRRRHLWLVLVPVFLLASIVVLCAGPRYRLPIDPFLCVLAALAAATLRPTRY